MMFSITLFLRRYKDSFDYIFMNDLDESLIISSPQFSTIGELLQFYETKNPDSQSFRISSLYHPAHDKAEEV